MSGNIYIKGKLHIFLENDKADLKKNGITIHVRDDVFFHIDGDKPDIVLNEDDVVIENIFNKIDVKDIFAFSTLNNETV